MKKLCSLLLTLLLVAPSYGQLTADHNSLRVGDVIVKQQVEYKYPGEAAPNQIWDFSQLSPISDEYELVYSEAPLIGDSIYLMGYNQFDKKAKRYADLIVGTEHNTMYYFYQTWDSLLLLGHENAAVKQENIRPLVNLHFPLIYNQKVTSTYQSQGRYSAAANIQSEGTNTLHADAYGIMILPSGDTINPVLRVKTEQSIQDITENIVSDTRNDRGRILKSYKWYSKGYRYPIFETVELIDLNDQSQLFATAFFYPPQAHFYLDTDPDNLALLEELWDFEEEEDIEDAFKEISFFGQEQVEGLNPRIYPNPVSDILNVEYTLDKDSPVTITIATINGQIVRNISKGQQQAGEQYEQIDCSTFTYGAYILKIVAGDQVVSGKILKK